ncbi:hypothetical protein [Sphingopyxis sp. GW247-27LB]|uniref:hypothetical protein n=1 Tax=Sphingopyxis sp. GW247-27LB TaxID=2012632 RepID=UPI000BA5D552|nr:hypothetical protein [Sphingopyxis sp. GW247-27LB]PAL19672.1 hypothetical protein CD928_19955 [Sphingopyxis sp. GW247-27LB]
MTRAMQSSRSAGIQLGVGLPYVFQATLDDPPLAPERLMFVTHAIAHVGAITEADWGAAERTALHFPEPPIPSTMTVDKLLTLRHAPQKPPAVSLSGTSGWNHRSALAEQSDYAAEIAKWEQDAPERRAEAERAVADDEKYYADWVAGIAAHSAAALALRRAAKALCRAVVDERVTPYARPVNGGDTVEMERSIWSDETVPGRIVRSGSLSLDAGKSWLYLFVDRAELMKEFSPPSSPSEAVEGRDLSALSPYLQLLIAVAEKQAITADNHSTVESLKADLLAEAPHFGLSVGTGNDGSDFSATLAGDFAKAIRWPNARRGKAKGGNQKT